MVETPTYDIERDFDGPIAGVDEAGRGPWAGPVVAAAVILDPATAPEGLRDSKALTEKRRRALAASLWQSARIGVGVASVDEIDTLNILRASLLAMTRAVANLPVAPKTALIDGHIRPKLSCKSFAIIRGDAKSMSIAAASIIAKTTRDRMMLELSRDYPDYDWQSNKGYAAPAHRDALNRCGITPHHRRSFSPIHKMLYDGVSDNLLETTC